MDIQSSFNLIAKEYDENRKKFIPCFEEYYGSVTDFAAKSLNKRPALIFDLGSGTGLLPSFWLSYFPEAHYVLVDLAEEMLAIAKNGLKRLLPSNTKSPIIPKNCRKECRIWFFRRSPSITWNTSGREAFSG